MFFYSLLPTYLLSKVYASHFSDELYIAPCDCSAEKKRIWFVESAPGEEDDWSCLNIDDEADDDDDGGDVALKSTFTTAITCVCI